MFVSYIINLFIKYKGFLSIVFTILKIYSEAKNLIDKTHLSIFVNLIIHVLNIELSPIVQ